MTSRTSVQGGHALVLLHRALASVQIFHARFLQLVAIDLCTLTRCDWVLSSFSDFATCATRVQGQQLVNCKVFWTYRKVRPSWSECAFDVGLRL